MQETATTLVGMIVGMALLKSASGICPCAGWPIDSHIAVLIYSLAFINRIMGLACHTNEVCLQGILQLSGRSFWD